MKTVAQLHSEKMELLDLFELLITIFSQSQESWMFRITEKNQTLEDGIYAEDYNSYEEALEAAINRGWNYVAENRRKTLGSLKNLIGKRFTEFELNKRLSEIFKEDIKVENISKEDDDLQDFDFYFNTESNYNSGFYDINFLMTRDKGVYYITGFSYEHDC